MDASRDTSPYRAEQKATAGMVAWGVAWVATLALARFGPESWGVALYSATWGAVGLNLIAGVGWIVAFARFLGAIDELQRRILQDAMATALGAGLVLGSASVIASAGGLVPFDVDLALLTLVMGGAFVVAFIVGKLRYR